MKRVSPGMIGMLIMALLWSGGYGIAQLQQSGGGGSAVTIQPGTSLIGTTLPKTGCGTTVYDSGPTNIPNTLTQLTATATCVEAIYCKALDSSAHPITVTDQSTSCNSAACNLVPPAFSLPGLSEVRFPLGYVKAVGGLKWNTDIANKVTCWVEGVQ